MLEARLCALLNILKPADEPVITRAVATLRAAFPAANDGHENAVLTVRLYVSALNGFPEWAVSEACRKALEGRLGSNPGFAPTPPQLAQGCRELVAKFIDERGKIERVLNAEVARHTTPEDRARAVERWEEMRKGFGAGGAPQPKEDPEATLERMLSDESPMKSKVVIGGELAKKIEAIKQGN